MGYEMETDDVIVMGDEAYLKVLRDMKDRGEITLEQYAESLRRAKNGV